MNAFKRLWQPVYQSHRGLSITISRFTLIVMMACLAFGFSRFILRVSLELPPPNQPVYVDYLMVFAALYAAEAMYTLRRVSELDGKDLWIFRAAEWLTLLIMFKLFVLLQGGIVGMIAEITQWQDNLVASFFSAPFLLGTIFLAMVWLVSTFLSAQIDDLHDREQDAAWDELGKVQNALYAIRNRIMSTVFTLGGMVLFFAIGARLNVRSFVPVLADRFDPSVPIANVLIFFVLTLILLSQTQFALLRTRWLWNKTPVASGLARGWLIYGLLFFSILALISFIMPTNYSLGFFETLRYALNFLGEIFRLLIALILLPLTICAQLFPQDPGVQQSAPAVELAPPPPPSAPEGAPADWLTILRHIIFWGGIIGVTIFALTQYIKSNAFLFKRIAQMPVLKWVLDAFRSLWAWLVGANRTVVTLIGAGLRRLRPPSSPIQRLNRLLRRPSGLTPREQVIEIYLTLVELGQEIGPARGSAETPYQYGRDMIGAHPLVTNEILDLTDAFNEARYSDHAIQVELIQSLREKWTLIHRQLEKEHQNDTEPTISGGSAENAQ